MTDEPLSKPPPTVTQAEPPHAPRQAVAPKQRLKQARRKPLHPDYHKPHTIARHALQSGDPPKGG